MKTLTVAIPCKASHLLVALFATIWFGASDVFAQSTPTATVDEQPTPTETLPAESTPTATPEDVDTPSATATPTSTPTEVDTPTETGTPTTTPTPTETGTSTPTPTRTPIPTERRPRACLGSTVRETIDCGEVVTCSFATTGDLKGYTFFALPGDVPCISTAPLDNSVVEPSWRLVDPSFEQVPGCTSRTGGTACCDRIEAEGEYTVIVGEFGNNEIGGYAISLHGVSSTNRGASLNCATRIGCGALANAELRRPSDLDAYRFIAAAGDAVRISTTIQAGLSLRPQWALYQPDGRQVPGCSTLGGGVQTCTGLPVSGTYTLLVSDRQSEDSGEYMMSLQFISETNCCGTPIADGESIQRSFVSLGDVDAYAFTAETGAGITLNTAARGSSVEPRWRVFGPDGSRVNGCSTLFGGQETCLGLPLTGTYTVVVDDANADATGDYNISMQGAAGFGECQPVAGCEGDCNLDGWVTLDEVLLGMQIGLGQERLEACEAIDGNRSGVATIDELVGAVTSMIEGCL